MKVLFIAPLPPPVHGSAMVSQYIKDSRVVNEAFDCDFVNLSTSRSMEEIGKGGVKKLFRFLASYLIVLWKLITHRYSLCYLAITCHGMGFLKDAPFVLLCKLFCRKVVLHQHNKGLSRDVARWPYRWLMPLVYRNTTVMLLSWHLYEDVSSVVKRGQVVVCANGVPPLDNGQQSTDNGLLRDETISHTEEIVNGQQTTDNSQLSTDGLFNQHDKHTNLDALTHTQACAGHPGCSQISHTELTEDTEFSCNAENICQRELDTNSQNLHDASPVRHPDGTVDRRPLTVDTCLGTKQVELRSIKEYRTPGDIDIWLHGERDEILEYVRRHIPDCKPVYHHVDFPVLDDVSIEVHFTPTWMNSPVRNRCLQRFFKSMVNSQQSTDGLFNQRDKHTNLDASTHTQACAGHPDEGFGLTQKSQKSQKNIVSQDKQSTLDENSQNLQVASPLLASGVIACSDHELHGLHEYSGASETKIISHGCSRIDTDSRIASLACGHPDEDTELNVESLMFNEGSQRLNDNVNDNHDGIYTTSPLQGTPPNLGGEINCPDGTVDRRPLTVDTCLDSKQATLPVPNAAFNRVYILVHIYRHLFAEGIGLRQLLDYYFVLQQGFTEVEREETLRTLRSLGMMRFTRAVMWVLQEVYAMPDRYLLTSPDEEEGQFLLDEIMLAGNFGKHDERMQRAEGEGAFRWGLRKVLRNFRFVRSYPSEVLWSPLFKVWHLFWRIRR